MAYKAETDDVRESPALQIAGFLRNDGYQVRQYDPLVEGHEYESLANAVEGSDLLAILVPHRVVIEEFRAGESMIRAAMRTPRVMVF
jgi:UDP-N-acetyl-D-mannosaminuronic acid dehydrogenase